MLLENKVAVISGAAGPRGIGMATAQLFVEQGARVVILDLDETSSNNAARELGDGHKGFACDVTRMRPAELPLRFSRRLGRST